jgi:hypothetical protein
MPGQVAGVTKCIANNPIKNNSQTIVMGGNVNDVSTNAPSLPSQLSITPFYGSNLAHAVSPGSSGNIGTARLSTSVKFGYNNPDYIISKITTSIAGSANTLTQSMASDTPSRRPMGRFYGYTRHNVTSYDIHGIPTKGAAAGGAVLASGLNGVTGFYADQANPRPGVPAELTFMTGAANPTDTEYQVQKST